MRRELTREPPPQKLVPLGARVEVELIRGPDMTDKGIIVPAGYWNSGVVRVVAAGPDCKSLKRGDLALAPATIESRTVRYGGIETYVCEEGYLYGALVESEAARILDEMLAAAG